MKKFMFLVLVIMALVVAPNAYSAVGACTQILEDVRIDIQREPFQKVLTFTCIGHSTGGSFPAIAVSDAYLPRIKGWYLYKIISNPGGVAPAADWDFTITDGDGIDLLGSAGVDRSATLSQSVYPLIGTQPFAQPIIDTPTLNITNVTTNSGELVIKAIFVR